VTISRFQVEFIVNFRVFPNSRNGVYAHNNRLKSRNESVNSASHKHSKKRQRIGTLNLDSVALYAAQFCYANITRLLCGVHNFYDRKNF